MMAFGSVLTFSLYAIFTLFALDFLELSRRVWRLAQCPLYLR
jgi:hypothetical protein